MPDISAILLLRPVLFRGRNCPKDWIQSTSFQHSQGKGGKNNTDTFTGNSTNKAADRQFVLIIGKRFANRCLLDRCACMISTMTLQKNTIWRNRSQQF